MKAIYRSKAWSVIEVGPGDIIQLESLLGDSKVNAPLGDDTLIVEPTDGEIEDYCTNCGQHWSVCFGGGHNGECVEGAK